MPMLSPPKMVLLKLEFKAIWQIQKKKKELEKTNQNKKRQLKKYPLEELREKALICQQFTCKIFVNIIPSGREWNW